MTVFTTQEDYLQGFQSTFEVVEKRESNALKDYLTDQIRHLNTLVDQISSENFWEVWPKILGIDAKINLVAELINFEDFSSEDILRIVETDYRTYVKELCGYDLSMETKHSMVFNVM
ncbi:MAG: DUF7006 family protein [Enterococcus casseliflavus]